MTKQLLKLTTLTALTLALTACGGGGGSDGGTTPPSTNTGTGGGIAGTTATILAPCAVTNNDEGFANATDVTNKTLHKIQSTTVVNVWDLPDGSKKACTSIGSVEIL